MASITHIEKQVLFGLVSGLKKSYLQYLLRVKELDIKGSKGELINRIQAHLEDGRIKYENLVALLDAVSPWQKQHVFLYKGPSAGPKDWKDEAWVENYLKEQEIDNLFNKTIPLALPSELTLISIQLNVSRLRIFAVQQLESVQRQAAYDKEQEFYSDGTSIEYKAYVHYISRGMTIFEWDLNANTGLMQILQLPSGNDYEAAEERFKTLVEPWFNLQPFNKLQLSRAIKKLDELEEAGTPEAKAHAISWDTITGRRWAGKSNTAGSPVRGDRLIDQATNAVRGQSAGRLGNFNWLPPFEGGRTQGNPLGKAIRVEIIGNKNRVNFPKDYGEGDMRYVLGRIRALSR